MNSTGSGHLGVDPDAAVASHRRRGRRRLLLGGTTAVLALGAAFALFTPTMAPTAVARTAPTEPPPEGPPGTHPCTVDDALAGAGTAHAGLTLTQVKATLRAGAEVRVIGEDGWCTPLTRDYRPQRTNLYLENGLVVRSSMG